MLLNQPWALQRRWLLPENQTRKKDVVALYQRGVLKVWAKDFPSELVDGQRERGTQQMENYLFSC